MIPSVAPNPPESILCISQYGSIDHGEGKVMDSKCRQAISTVRILIPLVSLVFGTAYAAEPADATPVRLMHAVGQPTRAPLDLRVPDLHRVMSHSELLAEMGSISDDEDSIEVVAAPALVPMSFDAVVPLGIIDSVRWSVDHPAQTWRIVLPVPATVTP
jgi:hypothetical protein